MPEKAAGLFERLKRKRTVITKRHAALDIFFRLDFDNAGAFSTIVDRNGHEIETS